MPCSSSMTSPPPRVAKRSVPPARTKPTDEGPAERPGFARAPDRAGEGQPRPGCGDFVGILTAASGACLMTKPSLPALPQVRGLAPEAPAIGLEPITCRLTEGLSWPGSARPVKFFQPAAPA